MASTPRPKHPPDESDPVTERGVPPKGKGPWEKPDATETELADDDDVVDADALGRTEVSISSSRAEEAEAFEREGDRDLYGEDEYPAEDEEYISPEAAAERTGTNTRQRGGTQIGGLPPGAQGREDSPDATNAGPPLKLEIITGPDEGEVKRFKGVRMVIGRVAGCHVVLNDQTVSRRHLELVYGPRGVLLRDLESGNGTTVNGERVTERILQHGDEVALGSTQFRLVDERVLVQEAQEEAERKVREEEERVAAAIQAREAALAAEAQAEEQEEQTGTDSREPTASMPAQLGWRKYLPGKRGIAIGASAIVLIGIFSFVMVTKKPPPPPEDPKELQARKKYAFARTALDDERYEDAIRHIEEAERLSAGVDSEGLLTQARAELSAIKSLETAQGLIAQLRFEDARAELARTPDASEKRNQERARLLELLDAQQTQALENTAQQALGANDFATAENAIALMPPARQPAWRTRLEEKQGAVAAEKAAQVQREREALLEKEAAERARLMESAFGSVSRKLNEGNFERATLECDRVIEQFGAKDAAVRERALKIKKLIPRFARTWAEGVRRARDDSPQAAYKTLEEALELYKQIDLPGALESDIGTVLNEASLVSARAAWARADYGSAAVAYRGVLDRAPENRDAREGMERLGSKADELYRTANMVRDRDPKSAIQMLKAVLDIVPPSSPLYQKAKERLKLLSP